MANKKQPTILTPEEQAIKIRSDAEDKSWHTIREDELNDFSLMENPLDLPEEAARLQKNEIYAFRWCERKPARIDQLTRSVNPPLKWGIVNKTTVSDLAHLVDPLLGCIPCVDQILLYKPWTHHRIVQEAKMKRAEAGLNAGSLEGKKRQIESRDTDVEVFTGADYKIGSGDEVLMPDLVPDDTTDNSPLGDLVVGEE